MSKEVILHGYVTSPFGEKAALMLNHKAIPWKKVETSSILPRPFETPDLSGKYRRSPFLQIGADIYCDTNMIAQALEKHFPEPTLFPKAEGSSMGHEALSYMLSQFTDKFFFGLTVPQIDWSTLPIEFLKDRAELRGGSREEEPKPLDPNVMMASRVLANQQLHQFFSMVEHQLSSSPTGWFLGTKTPHYADYQLFAPVQFVGQLRKGSPGSGVAHGFDVYPATWKWHKELYAYGDKVKHKEANVQISAEDAFKIAEKVAKAGTYALAQVTEKAKTVGVPTDGLGVNSEDNVNVRMPNVAEGKATGAEFSQYGGTYSLMRDTGKGFQVQIHFPGIGYFYSKV